MSLCLKTNLRYIVNLKAFTNSSNDVIEYFLSVSTYLSLLVRKKTNTYKVLYKYANNVYFSHNYIYRREFCDDKNIRKHY